VLFFRHSCWILLPRSTFKLADTTFRVLDIHKGTGIEKTTLIAESFLKKTSARSIETTTVLIVAPRALDNYAQLPGALRSSALTLCVKFHPRKIVRLAKKQGISSTLVKKDYPRKVALIKTQSNQTNNLNHDVLDPLHHRTKHHAPMQPPGR
jgi:hypothetical protein